MGKEKEFVAAPAFHAGQLAGGGLAPVAAEYRVAYTTQKAAGAQAQKKPKKKKQKFNPPTQRSFGEEFRSGY